MKGAPMMFSSRDTAIGSGTAALASWAALRQKYSSARSWLMAMRDAASVRNTQLWLPALRPPSTFAAIRQFSPMAPPPRISAPVISTRVAPSSCASHSCNGFSLLGSSVRGRVSWAMVFYLPSRATGAPRLLIQAPQLQKSRPSARYVFASTILCTSSAPSRMRACRA